MTRDVCTFVLVDTSLSKFPKFQSVSKQSANAYFMYWNTVIRARKNNIPLQSYKKYLNYAREEQRFLPDLLKKIRNYAN